MFTLLKITEKIEKLRIYRRIRSTRAKNLLRIKKGAKEGKLVDKKY